MYPYRAALSLLVLVGVANAFTLPFGVKKGAYVRSLCMSADSDENAIGSSGMSIRDARKLIRGLNAENFATSIEAIEPFLLHDAKNTMFTKSLRRISNKAQALGLELPENFAKAGKPAPTAFVKVQEDKAIVAEEEPEVVATEVTEKPTVEDSSLETPEMATEESPVIEEQVDTVQEHEAIVAEEEPEVVATEVTEKPTVEDSRPENPEMATEETPVIEEQVDTEDAPDEMAAETPVAVDDTEATDEAASEELVVAVEASLEQATPIEGTTEQASGEESVVIEDVLASKEPVASEEEDTAEESVACVAADDEEPVAGDEVTETTVDAEQELHITDGDGDDAEEEIVANIDDPTFVEAEPKVAEHEQSANGKEGDDAEQPVAKGEAVVAKETAEQTAVEEAAAVSPVAETPITDEQATAEENAVGNITPEQPNPVAVVEEGKEAEVVSEPVVAKEEKSIKAEASENPVALRPEATEEPATELDDAIAEHEVHSEDAAAEEEPLKAESAGKESGDVLDIEETVPVAASEAENEALEPAMEEVAA